MLQPASKKKPSSCLVLPPLDKKQGGVEAKHLPPIQYPMNKVVEKSIAVLVHITDILCLLRFLCVLLFLHFYFLQLRVAVCLGMVTSGLDSQCHCCTTNSSLSLYLSSELYGSKSGDIGQRGGEGMINNSCALTMAGGKATQPCLGDRDVYTLLAGGALRTHFMSSGNGVWCAEDMQV